ncbi:MAG: hypothetical protein HYV27_08975 [Candidatus Hydrogenedentes bacterium]|nr:hypothetical protein [Candidatus Hydrogenedentota bacterium]
MSEVNLVHFPWNLELKYNACKISLALFGTTPFDMLFKQASLYELLKELHDYDGLPSEKRFKVASNRARLHTSIGILLAELDKAGHKTKTLEYFCARDGNDVSSGGWGNGAAIRTYSNLVHNHGLLLPHEGVRLKGSYRNTNLFFMPATWDFIKDVTFFQLFSTAKNPANVVFNELIKLGKTAGIIKMGGIPHDTAIAENLNFGALAEAPETAMKYVRTKLVNDRICYCTTTNTCSAPSSSYDGCYCQTVNGVCSNSSDCEDDC